MKTLCTWILFALVGIGVSATILWSANILFPEPHQYAPINVTTPRPPMPIKIPQLPKATEQKQPVQPAPNGWNTINVVIYHDPTSLPEPGPTFDGLNVLCTWNGFFYRGIHNNLLLVDINYTPLEGGWCASYTTHACAQPLGIQYGMCNGWRPCLPDGKPDNSQWGGICEIVPYGTYYSRPYSVRYKFTITP